MSAARPHDAALTVGVIGAGRVGAVLGAALARAGHDVVAVSAISEASVRRAAELLPGVRVVAPSEVPGLASLLLLSVPDDALADLVAGLAATGTLSPGQLVVHTSGLHGLEVLEPATRAGALPIALHPVLPFTGTEVDLARLSGASFGVTSPEPLRPIAESLVVEMGGEPVWLPDDARPLWHAALAHGSNHLVTLVASAADLLRQAGVEEPGRVLAPLLGAALDGSLRAGDAVLTGPVSRGDAGTVRAHLDVLAALAPEVLPSYVAMARLTADRALASGRLDPHAAGALLEVLGTVPR
ncbi:MAG: hypothetical protein QOD98_1081 [Nocardioidaceae bacterium]|jgi:predicted short-subunit dehydrogenase-like oxidoreductase (DUF2520 family)|nr:hypothetical protein [Nocardioidaceae bacterium]